ncbi:hypothetical protein SLS58_001058 [Diplodia intermedia]|uniref:Gtp binding protein n=1 Tax=Diplodia intermedia TaxID=856260 RepID=A0ABR3U386_9PEZI
MDWPAADDPLSLIGAVKAFLDSPDQEPSRQSLEPLLARLDELRRGDQPELWDRLIESLADACRDPKWREPIEQSGILKYYLESLDAASLPTASSKQLLRAVGNGVADRDESRAVVLPFLDKIMSCLQNPALLPVAVSVLYNTCLGYDDKILHKRRPQACASTLIELLAWVSDKLSDDVLAESEDCLNAVIQSLSSCEEWEDFKHLIAAASVYLQDGSIQSKILHSDGMSQITALLKQKTDQLDQLQASMDDEEKKDFLEDLRIATGLVMNAIAAITASDDFTRLYTLSSPLIREQGAWLSSPSPILRTCACITLGNIAVSDAVNVDMVHEHSHHLPTLRILQTATDRTELYLAAGFLRHLAQPAANVEPVTQATPPPLPTLAALLDRKEPELDFEAAAVLRRLVNNSRATAAALAKDDTTLDKLLTAAKQTKTGFEVGRLLIAVCRKLRERQNDPAEPDAVKADTERCWASLLAHDELLRPLVLMVRQEQVPALASEAWFGLGLLVAAPTAGVRKVADAFAEDEDNWNALRKAATTGDRDSADRKNAMTTVNLVARLLEEGEEKRRWSELLQECCGEEGSTLAITQ